MTTRQQILSALKGEQATTGAIAEFLHLPCKVVEAFLQDLELEDLVASRQIAATLKAWYLTDAGNALTKPTTDIP